MNILMVTPYLPYPLLSGGQIRTYNLLKNLAGSHKITLFSLIKSNSEKKHIQALSPFCQEIKVFKRTQNPFALRNILLAGFTAYPFLVTRNLPQGMNRAIARQLRRHRYDLIHAETFYMMPNIPHTNIPILLVEQTIEYLGYLFYAKSTKHWPLKPLLYLDIAKLKFWEQHFWKKANHLVTMSTEDKTYITDSIGNKTPIDVVANGVDIDFFNQTRRQQTQHPTVLFVGTFKWLPNVDAVTYLVEQIWPQIIAKLPQAKLWIVGHSPTDSISQYARDPSITVSSNIEDIREAYGNSNVLLAPIRSGKGTRYKILEAMATGTPVVTTKLGAEGLAVKPGHHLLIADSAQDLATSTVKVLQNTPLSRQLSETAKTFVSTNYNWQTISSSLDQLYRKLGESS